MLAVAAYVEGSVNPCYVLERVLALASDSPSAFCRTRR